MSPDSDFSSDLELKNEVLGEEREALNQKLVTVHVMSKKVGEG